MIPDFPVWVWWSALASLAFGVVLAGLKLFKVIAWSWWAIAIPFAPILILPVLVLLLVALMVLDWSVNGFH